MFWYHGTDKSSCDSIKQNGFNHAHNWFTKDLEYAKQFGPYILVVYFDDPVNSKYTELDSFQRCEHTQIKPERVKILEEEST